MKRQLIECVPNISEGRDAKKIQEITNVIETIEGVKLLNIDPGKATNRTVITFVGEPQQVIDAAFLLIQKAQNLIDMSKHSGEHPRMGATDVCPLVPIANISMQETAQWAHKLAERVGKELNIPIYCYENAATEEKRKNLADCRSGEYEGLKQKLIDPDFKIKEEARPNNQKSKKFNKKNKFKKKFKNKFSKNKLSKKKKFKKFENKDNKRKFKNRKRPKNFKFKKNKRK